MSKNLIKTISTILPTFFFALWSLVANGFPIKDDSLHYEILLTNKMLNDIQLNEKFITSIDITSKRLILLSTNDQFYLLGWGGIKPIGEKVTGSIASYAFTSDNLLLTIRNNELCSFDSLGNLSQLFKLPNYGMGISAGKYVMYVYDRNKEKVKHALYLIAKGGKYTKLFEVPSPIQSVVEINNSILFATGSDLFKFDIKSKDLKVLVALQKDKEIKSIAVDSSNNRIYFSTENAIYALKDSSAVIITKDFGGVLRYFNNGLIVFNPEKKLLVRILGIEDKIESKMQVKNTIVDILKSTDTLTNYSIIKLVKAKITNDIIINIINSYKVNFNVGIDSMILLSNQNVSSAVILAMKNAMKRKNGKESKGNN